MKTKLYIPIVLLSASLSACVEAPRDVPLQVLVQEAATLDGRMVRTNGNLRVYEDPRHYWIEDDNFHRIAVMPEHVVSEFVGQQIEVTGRFRASAESGREIQVHEAVPYGSEP
ncbi:MAG: glucose-inhibited division protein B [Idiomarina sp.]|nr:glucose-inhibited division protein B [Idiomarina sp.]